MQDLERLIFVFDSGTVWGPVYWGTNLLDNVWQVADELGVKFPFWDASEFSSQVFGLQYLYDRHPELREHKKAHWILFSAIVSWKALLGKSSDNWKSSGECWEGDLYEIFRAESDNADSIFILTICLGVRKLRFIILCFLKFYTSRVYLKNIITYQKFTLKFPRSCFQFWLKKFFNIFASDRKKLRSWQMR